ncbi:hypothetical protein GCM10028791_12060 [Echinicola sediminis]
MIVLFFRNIEGLVTFKLFRLMGILDFDVVLKKRNVKMKPVLAFGAFGFGTVDGGVKKMS